MTNVGNKKTRVAIILAGKLSNSSISISSNKETLEKQVEESVKLEEMISTKVDDAFYAKEKKKKH